MAEREQSEEVEKMCGECYWKKERGCFMVDPEEQKKRASEGYCEDATILSFMPELLDIGLVGCTRMRQAAGNWITVVKP